MAKLDAWKAWRGFAARRLRFKVLVGIVHAVPDAFSLRHAWAAWRAYVAAAVRLKPQSAHTADLVANEAGTAHAEHVQAQGARAPAHSGTHGDGAGDSGSGCAALGFMPALPPCWKEPISKAAIMDAVDKEERLPTKYLKRKVQAVDVIQVCAECL